jgi:AcrR family transcriptional regulator
LFYEKGFHGVGVDQIGARVGISGPALYRHFQGKDEILATLFNETLEELISATAAVYAEPHRDLERLIRHHVEFAINHRHLVNVYQREERSLVEPWKRQFQRRERIYAARWEEALARCYPAAPAEQIAAAAQAAIGLIHSVAHWPHEARRTPDLADLLYCLVTEGLTALERPAGRKRRQAGAKTSVGSEAAATGATSESAATRAPTRKRRTRAA